MTIAERIRYKLGYEILGYQQNRLDKENYAGRKNLTIDQAGEMIAEKIRSGEPFDVIRMGISELQFLSVHTGATRIPESFFYGLWIGDLLKNDSEIDRFVQLYLDACENADFAAVWYYSYAEEKIMKEHALKAQLCPSRSVEPYYQNNPWTHALAGKKVLVVNPFAETIRKQYEKRMEIYPSGLLPEFELIAIPSVWYNTSEGNARFGNWFEALEYLESRVCQYEFDIALLGCGPFGTPLTSYIKKMGKQAIYIGGALQILFGIRGSRWDQVPAITAMYNEAWVSPGDDNKPSDLTNLDDGCYW